MMAAAQLTEPDPVTDESLGALGAASAAVSSQLQAAAEMLAASPPPPPPHLLETITRCAETLESLQKARRTTMGM